MTCTTTIAHTIKHRLPMLNIEIEFLYFDAVQKCLDFMKTNVSMFYLFCEMILVEYVMDLVQH